jgi:hypothetical protein
MSERRRVQWIAGIAMVLAAVSASSSRARAEDARLEYAAAAPDCPTESALRASVAMRLGYDPFTADAARVVRVEIRATESGVEATVQMLDTAGRSVGRRDLEDTGSCAELADVLVLAVSIAIDPERALGAGTEGGAGVEAGTEGETAAGAGTGAGTGTGAETGTGTGAGTTGTGTGAENGWRLGAGISVLGEVGFTPSPTAGASIDLRARLGMWSLALSGYGVLPTGADVVSGRVATYRAGAALVPCVHADFFAGCAIVQLGAMVGRGESVPISREATAPFLALGARARAEWTIEEHLLLAIFVDVLLTPTPTELRIDGQGVWSTGVVAGVVGASVGFETSVR